MALAGDRPLTGLRITDPAAREDEGQPPDRQLAHWLAAEADVLRNMTGPGAS